MKPSFEDPCDRKPSRMMARTAKLIAALAATAAVSIPAVARAKPEFPPDIARHLSATEAPACSVCHLEGKTGGITVVTPFAFALRAHGFTDSTSTLNAALDQMDTDGTDSDGDGVSDVAELRAGTDPNSPVPGATTADPRYGCEIVSSGGHAGWAGLVAIFAAVVLRRRRRARATPPS
jgi:MYXO-CTERM domain-containing protein